MTVRPGVARIWRSWAALLVLLALTTGVAFIPLGPLNAVIALVIAATKALIVLIIFMELRQSAGLTRAFAIAGFFWLLILLGLTTIDYATRRDVPAGVHPLAPRAVQTG